MYSKLEALRNVIDISHNRLSENEIDFLTNIFIDGEKIGKIVAKQHKCTNGWSSDGIYEMTIDTIFSIVGNGISKVETISFDDGVPKTTELLINNGREIINIFKENVNNPGFASIKDLIMQLFKK